MARLTLTKNYCPNASVSKSTRFHCNSDRLLNHECALVSNHLATCTVSRMRACLVAMSYAQPFSKSPITLDSGRIVASPAYE